MTAVSSFPTVPALSSRVHYTRSKNKGGKASLVASLDIEVAPFSEDSLKIAAVQVSVPNGVSVDLVSPHLSKEQIFRPRDVVVYLFRLILDPSAVDGSTPTAAQTADISVEADVLVSATSTARIRMRWQTGVDFSAALNPIYGAPGQSMQRGRRPSTLAVAPPSTKNKLSAAGSEGTEQKIDPNAPTRTRSRAASINDLGITVTFTAPTKVVTTGKSFKWDILIYNGSSKPRQFSLTAIPQRGKPSLTTGGASRPRDDEYVTTQNIIPLDTEIRTGPGPLAPGACAEHQMRFLPLEPGVLQLEAVRVVDLLMGESTDVKDLPDIIAAEE